MNKTPCANSSEIENYLASSGFLFPYRTHYFNSKKLNSYLEVVDQYRKFQFDYSSYRTLVIDAEITPLLVDAHVGVLDDTVAKYVGYQGNWKKSIYDLENS